VKTLKRLAPLLPYAAAIIGIQLLQNVWIAIAIYKGGVILLFACTRRWPVRRSKRVNAIAVLTVVSCVVSGPLLYLLWNILKIEGLSLSEVTSRLGLAGISWWLFAVYLCTVHPLLEEAFWRGFLGSDSPLPIMNDLLFGGYHAIVLILYLQWPYVVLCCLSIAGAGWMWRRVCAATGGMTWAIAAHAFADIGIAVVATALGAGQG
jgi:hypothetical protein